MTDWQERQRRWKEDQARAQQKLDDERRHRERLSQEKQLHHEQMSLHRQREQSARMREAVSALGNGNLSCMSVLVTIGLVMAAIAVFAIASGESEVSPEQKTVELDAGYEVSEAESVPEPVAAEDEVVEETIPVSSEAGGEVETTAPPTRGDFR